MTVERRRSARLADRVTFQLACKGFDIIGDTVNIGAHGILCRVNEDIPTMTKIDIRLVLPNAKEVRRCEEIRAKGVVVRTEPDPRTKTFRLAVFFTDISKTARTLLENYINGKLGPLKRA